MRYLSWVLSFLLHGTLVLILLQTVHLTPLSLEDVMEVDLAEMAVPDVVATLPVPQPPPPEPVAEEPEGPPAPLPLDPAKTVVIDDSPPPPEPTVEPAPLAPPEPEVVEISPVKVPVAPEEKAEEPGRRIDVRKGDTIVHRGHEARFGRSMMADYYSYESTEFSGQFHTRDGRTISIIDARNTKYGRFLIYDSKNKTLRRLKQFGKYVYTIGPSVYEDEPVIGTVTFLAMNDRIERFILMTDDDRIAHYPRKVHVREETVAFASEGGERAGLFSRPPYDEGHAGVVFVPGNRCVEPGLVQGFTRALSARNLAVLYFPPDGCAGEGDSPAGDDGLVRDTGRAFGHLLSTGVVAAEKAGLWGNGSGVPVVVEAAAAGMGAPAYLVCVLDDEASPGGVPPRAVLERLDMPVLWLVTGRDVARWQPVVTLLETLRDAGGKRFSIVIRPLKASREVLDARSEESGLVEQVAEDHARLAVSWIEGVAGQE